MATYSYATNAIEEAGLTLAVANLNAQPNSGNPPNPPNWSNQDLFSQNMQNDLLATSMKYQTTMLSMAIAAFPTANSDNQTLVLTKLGLTAYAGLSADALIPILQTLGMTNFMTLSLTDQVAVFTALGL